jgi:hypothetical protein
MMRHETDFTPSTATVATELPETATPPPAKGLTLRRYRVTHFRSVMDSGWLDADRVTALIGVNESGKTNLLLPLWKFNPASDGALQPTSDYPKALFATIRNAPDQFQFITCEFDTGERAAALAATARIPEDQARRVSVARLYDGTYRVAFPDYVLDADAHVSTALTALRQTRGHFAKIKNDPLQAEALTLVSDLLTELESAENITGNDLRMARNRVAGLIPEDPPATSKVIPHLRALQKTLGEQMAAIIAPDPASRDDVQRTIIASLPRFVYYSNYGNLDSEIYLPHVVDNLARADLGAKESAKARTLRVLFDFVGVSAQEILELGRDFRDFRDEAEARMIAEEGKKGLMRSLWQRARGTNSSPDHALLSQIAEAKRTRSILLQSAGTMLTERFGEWWKQGDYRFRFEADGNHFRIWVADARRPQEVELEHRSTGLQWFLSFFLVFLHEAKGAHDNCVLLLDEPGHSLHPLAQRDLSAFFEGLSTTNQILYTTHSPFLVDADRLARARKVFVGRDGSTRVSGDLLESEGSDSQRGAGFAVRAALNLAVAEVSMTGAQPVLVQSRVEQTYLTALKTLTIAAGDVLPQRDIIFAPACGPEVMPVMVRLLSETQSQPPRLVLDQTETGRALAANLPDQARATFLHDLIPGADMTIEDLFPIRDLAAQLDRIERRPDRLLSDVVRAGKPFVRQALDWATAEGITLPHDWRGQLAARMAQRLLDHGPAKLPDGLRANGKALLQDLTGQKA